MWRGGRTTALLNGTPRARFTHGPVADAPGAAQRFGLPARSGTMDGVMGANGHSPLATQLLGEVRQAHADLVARTTAAEPARRGLCALVEALSAGLADLTEDDILATPSPEEWSMAEVMEHIADHDRKYAELERLGLDHYVEHGLEHALQLWRLRPARDGVAP